MATPFSSSSAAECGPGEETVRLSRRAGGAVGEHLQLPHSHAAATAALHRLVHFRCEGGRRDGGGGERGRKGGKRGRERRGVK